MSVVYDMAILGSGFAGSLMGMIARRLGFSVVMIERGTHPRVVIGESSTPLANLLLEQLAKRYDLPQLLPLTKWGSWQREYPEIACGLKRGFSFVSGSESMLVAASPHDEIADTHWYRADFDQRLMETARELGVEYHDQVRLDEYVDADDEVELRGERCGREVRFRARFVVDATGPRGCLHRLLGFGEAAMDAMPKTQALYSHFSGVRRLAFPDGEAAPYPVDDAALHHVFDGGWIWILRFNNGLTSAGVAATDEAADRLGLRDGEIGLDRLLREMPAVREQMGEARAERAMTYLPRVSFRSGTIVGKRWAMLPSAAGFVDPLLSSGFTLSLLGIGRLAEVLEAHWAKASFAAELDRYAERTDGELLATSRLVGALYATMGNFAAFRAVLLLYFAAASFAETARRLSRFELARSFLLYDDARFGPAAEALLARARKGVSGGETEEFVRDVRDAIEPFDVAGLCKSPNKHWYPVNAEDLLSNAAKVGSSRGEIEAMLRRAGFYAAEQTIA